MVLPIEVAKLIIAESEMRCCLPLVPPCTSQGLSEQPEFEGFDLLFKALFGCVRRLAGDFGREVSRLDGIGRGNAGCAFDGELELTNVPWPGVGE